MKHYRYPGTQPFSQEYQEVFFGREDDIVVLMRMLSLHRQVTLFGKSGLGKSSLIEAGLLPMLEPQGYVPIRVRFNHYVDTNSPAPLTTFFRSLPESAQTGSFLDLIDPHRSTFWHRFKAMDLALHHEGKENATFLLIFDQFEELFSYPEGIDALAQELAGLLNDYMPSGFQWMLDQVMESDPLRLSEAQLAFLEAPLRVKALFAVRSDRLSLLDRLSGTLPSILQHCYELHPLGEKEARSAMIAPAALPGEDFLTPPYTYATATQEAMLGYLSHQGQVEPFQLQLLCSRIEAQVEKALPPDGQQMACPKCPSTALPDLDALFRNYYEDSLQQLDHPTQHAARLLLEEGLILAEEERRLTLDAGQITRQYDLPAEALQQLVDLRLLRAEPNPLGGRSYELSHDSLVAPILHARNERHTQEATVRAEAAARAQIEAEQAALQARYQRRLRRVSIASLIALVAAGAIFSVILLNQNKRLQAVGSQILMAYKELGKFVKLDQDPESLTKEDALDKATELSLEIQETKRALQQSRAKVEAFQRQTQAIQEKLEAGENLSTQDLQQLIGDYQENIASLGLDSVLDIQEENDDALKAEILSLSSKRQQEILDDYLREAQRLYERGENELALAKVDLIVALDPKNVAAETLKTTLEPPAAPNITAPEDSTEAQVMDPSPAVEEEAVLREDKGMTQDKEEEPSPVVPQPVEEAVSPEITEEVVSTPEDNTELILQLLTVADEAYEEKDWVTAKGRYGLVLKEDQNHVLATQRIADCEEHIERQNTLNDLLTRADREFTGENWEAAQKLYQEILIGDATHPLATQRKQICEQKLAEIAAAADNPPPFDPNADYLEPEMITVQGGSFRMGSEEGSDNEKPVHEVTLSTYAIGKYEVTNQEFCLFLNAVGNQEEGGETWYRIGGYGKIEKNAERFVVKAGYDRHPVNNVSWYGAQAYCQWLSQLTGKTYRLPTEAEWEFAARGGNRSQNYTYAGGDDAGAVAVYNSSGTAAVGGKQANELGLFDMSGNVWEWCADWYDKDYYAASPKQNPKGPASGYSRVLRGGSWLRLITTNLRVAYRYDNYPDYRYDYIGFRCARAL